MSDNSLPTQEGDHDKVQKAGPSLLKELLFPGVLRLLLAIGTVHFKSQATAVAVRDVLTTSASKLVVA